MKVGLLPNRLYCNFGLAGLEACTTCTGVIGVIGAVDLEEVAALAFWPVGMQKALLKKLVMG